MDGLAWVVDKGGREVGDGCAVLILDGKAGSVGWPKPFFSVVIVVALEPWFGVKHDAVGEAVERDISDVWKSKG